MIKNFIWILLFSTVLSIKSTQAQIYRENSGEFIFAFSNVQRGGIDIPTKMRFTLFFHAGQNMHYDFSNSLGFFSGYGIRNIGLVTEENEEIIKRRTYALGIPLAFKLGSFKDHFYFYGGGEYELFFHYKQKQYIDGNKTKQSEWFSNRTQRFALSVFAGFQFPRGINLKFKYYPENFINKDFKGYDFGDWVDYSDFNKTQLFYVSLSFNIKSKDIKKLYNPEGDAGRIAFL